MKKSFDIILKLPYGKYPKLNAKNFFFSDITLYQDIFHIKLQIIIYHIALSYGNNYTRCNQTNNLNILRIKDNSFTTRK
ncbi:hypothetical protein COE20_19080 [Bacillus cereus]|nr:hypothetical protein CON03_16715 [Bacillus cereus]PFE49406.1 hypothetical protein CN317_08260 [Bacillus cereus]PFN16231.1 hypothetical protein COJ72_05015 [Bacillus cereus]PFO68472.1 hypothetical protein COJ86_18445 [Bacillus cereus]PGY26265.1 hypothetical protein COE20_19080 [Bacillus cereus]